MIAGSLRDLGPIVRRRIACVRATAEGLPIPRLPLRMKLRFLRQSRWAAFLLCGTYAGCALVPGEVGRLSRRAEKPIVATASASGRSSIEDIPGGDTVPRDPADACLTTAREMEAHGDLTAAIEQYERARRMDPRRAGIHARLAELHQRVGNRDRAEAEYAAALREADREDTHNAELWNDYAGFQLEQRRLEEAERSARRALELEPEHPRAWSTLALSLAEQERYEESRAAFAKAVAPAAAHNNLAIILARQGKSDEARREFAAALRLDPTLRQPAESLKQLSEEYVRATQAGESSATAERKSTKSVARAVGDTGNRDGPATKKF